LAHTHTHSPSQPGSTHGLFTHQDGDPYLLWSGYTRRLLTRKVPAAVATARVGLRLVAAPGWSRPQVHVPGALSHR